MIQNDTVRVISNENRSVNNEKKDTPFNEDMVFLITEKTSTWNNDFTEGESNYKLIIKNEDGLTEYPTLKIIVKEKKGQMTLHYPGEGLRIFEMVIK